ncbi:hypothetical protein B5E92_06595 [Erysipelatoclostridium sp. An15]|uniref:anti-sigma-I factor RsgI family protein n=1 Tax=Erysipelatoclostridium sp. An15 TaxID=1965566 RepID=UPI000B3A3BA4|nr:PepSY domain-containing protein [Erysipelatoclostridium sp. An15]OUQ07764.1 hypothetical protein B5E92_06595 [Erysipelatoclostridium sp. An15]
MKNREIKDQLKKEFRQLQMNDIKKELLDEIKYVKQVEASSSKKTHRKLVSHWKMSAICLSMIIILSFVTVNFNQRSHDGCIVSFDVNPNIELEVNDENRVTDFDYHNEEGKLVLKDMDLIDTDIDVAVNAIIGSMFKNGYIDEIKNSVLVTVQGDDRNTREELKKRVANDVKEVLDGYSIQASVVSQDIEYSSKVEKLADEYQISVGKATLIQELINANPSYEFSDLTNLTINDLNTLVHYKNIQFKTITIDGVESHDGYLSDEEVKEKVLEHAKVAENEVISYQSNMDCDDNRLIFNVQMQDSYAIYNYQLNAISGEIITFNVEVNV